ncbi:MAG: YdeI/OmpD-associated family protein [Chitinophagaceae bacterium]
MTKSGLNPNVDFYFSKAKTWQVELEKLRIIVLDCGLTEELKWGVPCYTSPAGSSPSPPPRAGGRPFPKSNIVLIHVFKEYCALLFFKGSLLNDTNGLLIQQTKNVQAARQIRFTSVREIIKMKPILKAYIYEAIEVEKAGLKVDFKKASEFKIPEEFQNKLSGKGGPVLRTAFEALTPGRQRTYLLYFSAPKQSKTRESRVEKCMQQILNGKGLNDQ